MCFNNSTNDDVFSCSAVDVLYAVPAGGGELLVPLLSMLGGFPFLEVSICQMHHHITSAQHWILPHT